MTEFIIDYDAISVAQLYEMLDIPSDEFTLEKYGWYDLRAAQVRPVPSGYLLDLPKPRPID
jgi:hypothetical protein